MENLLSKLEEFKKVTLGKDVDSLSKYYEELNADFIDLANLLFAQKEKWEHAGDLESKLFRIYTTNASILKIATGHKFEFKGEVVNLHDIFSIFSLSRKLIENFLSTFYLFFDTMDEEESGFRLSTYRLNGLQRQLFLTSNIDNSNLKKQQLQIELNQVLRQIKACNKYLVGTPKQRLGYVNPKHAIAQKKEVLMERCGVAYIEKSWRLYSNHAHSEYISDRQYNSFYREGDGLKESLCLTLNNNCRITSRLIDLYCNKFGYARTRFETFSEANKFRVKMWNQINETLTNQLP